MSLLGILAIGLTVDLAVGTALGWWLRWAVGSQRERDLTDRQENLLESLDNYVSEIYLLRNLVSRQQRQIRRLKP